MRTFYIFKVRKEIFILLKDNPYNLFKTIENLYYIDNSNSNISLNIFSDLFDLYNKELTNKKINKLFQNNKYYSNDGDVHYIYNKYLPENTTLRVYKSHIIVKSDVIKPTLLVNYLMDDYLFVCDFKNKDYFWLKELASIKM